MSSAANGNHNHAMLWNGTSDSAVDLNPSGFSDSYANGTNGSLQVGYGQGTSTNGENHALLWNGTADSVVDLHSLIPAEDWTQAFTVDANGDIFGVGWSVFGYDAIEWVPTTTSTPEPGGVLVMGVGGLVVLCRRRRRSASIRG